jgi:hypothetical protein
VAKLNSQSKSRCDSPPSAPSRKALDIGLDQRRSVVTGAAIAIAMLVIGMLVLETHTANVAPGLALIDGKLSDARKESIAEMLSLVTLLMNWAVALIGACAFFLKFTFEDKRKIGKLDIGIIFFVIILSVASLFLGHLVIDQSSLILSLDQFPVNNARLRMLARYQYLVGLGSIAVFGFFIFQFYWPRGQDLEGNSE